jgi:hypothetical protein
MVDDPLHLPHHTSLDVPFYIIVVPHYVGTMDPVATLKFLRILKN